MKTFNNCPICGYENIKKVYELYDDRYGYPGFFTLFRCDNCKHIFLKNILTDNELYTKYYPRAEFEIDDYKPLNEVKGFQGWFNGDYRAFSAVPEKTRILDIGCGYCESLGYHKSRGCDVFGVELDRNAEKIAIKYNFSVFFGQFSSSIYDKEFFDYVTMDQVFEHLEEPEKLLKEINTVIKPNAKLIITMPNAYGWGVKIFKKKWINWHVPYHLSFYSQKSIKQLCKKTGFSINKIRTITSSNWLYYQLKSLINYPNPGVPSSFWKETHITDTNFKSKVLHKFVDNIFRLKILHVITRLFDIFNIGDNYFIELEKR